MERTALFIRLIDAFPKGHPLKRYRGDVYFEIRNFRVLFSMMKREGWTSDVVNKQINAYLASLEPNQVAEAAESMDKLQAAVHEFDNYQALLQQLGRYDAGDVPGPGATLLPEHPLIEKLVLLLEYLAAEQEIPGSGDEMLFELLHAEWFAIPPGEIAQLAIAAADRSFNGQKVSLRRLLYEKVHTPPRDLFAPPVTEGFIKASGAIERLTGIAPGTTLPDLVESMLRETGIGDFVMQQPDSQELQGLVTGFVHYVQEEAARNPAMDLPLLVKLITLMRAPAFPRPPLQIPVNNQDSIIPLIAAFYTSPISFRGIAWDLHKETSEVKMPAPEIGKLEEATVSRLLQRFVMNVTALNNFLRCPLEFYFRNIIRIPAPRNEAAEFGSAVHYALELLFRKMQSAGEAFPSPEIFMNDFETYMHLHRQSFTPEQFNRRLAYGHEVLSNYYDEYVDSWPRIVAVERNIRNVVVNGVPLKGKIDKLEFDGRLVNVVDYKTGDPEKSKARLMPPGEAIPLGGDYWRQAVFYKILVDNYQPKEWKVVSTEFDFIEPDKKYYYHKEKLMITPDDVAIVTQQLTMAWQRIQHRDFYTGCGKPECHWCHFVKTYGLVVRLYE